MKTRRIKILTMNQQNDWNSEKKVMAILYLSACSLFTNFPPWALFESIEISFDFTVRKIRTASMPAATEKNIQCVFIIISSVKIPSILLCNCFRYQKHQPSTIVNRMADTDHDTQLNVKPKSVTS